jgi:hypothetical protein
VAISASALLPIPRTRLIGREGERMTARLLLLDEAVPLLTLTGPGGVGKTRLALAIAGDVAGHFADGVAFVDLAPLADSGLVATTMAATLSVTPGPEQPVPAAIVGNQRDHRAAAPRHPAVHARHPGAGCPDLRHTLVAARSRSEQRPQGGADAMICRMIEGAPDTVLKCRTTGAQDADPIDEPVASFSPLPRLH